MSDREYDYTLVTRAQAGDQAAFAMLVAKYQRKVARLLSTLVSNPSDLDDVTQESFIKAYRSLSTFRGDSAFYTWLYRVAINVGKNYLHRQARNGSKKTHSSTVDVAEDSVVDERLSDNQTPELILLSKQMTVTLDEALEALPPELRIALTLREIEGLSYEEISVVMDCPMGTVRSRIYRAREWVAEKLKPLMDSASGKRVV